tara:strand:- start:962 stop:1183 length:222 start_codon:yes stop_codon:yes gene_type:complete
MVDKITQYKLAWDVNNGVGKILIKADSGQTRTFNFTDGSSFSATATLIQHEAPVFYDVVQGIVYCGAELVEDD